METSEEILKKNVDDEGLFDLNKSLNEMSTLVASAGIGLDPVEILAITRQHVQNGLMFMASLLIEQLVTVGSIDILQAEDVIDRIKSGLTLDWMRLVYDATAAKKSASSGLIVP